MNMSSTVHVKLAFFTWLTALDNPMVLDHLIDENLVFIIMIMFENQ